VQSAMVHACTRHGGEAPVARAADIHEPGLRVQYLGPQVVAAGLEQKNLHGQVLREATRDDGAGGARPDDDVVVGRLQLGAALGLIASDRQALSAERAEAEAERPAFDASSRNAGRLIAPDMRLASSRVTAVAFNF